jgi:large repetitive protein
MRHPQFAKNFRTKFSYLLISFLLLAGLQNEVFATHAAGSDIKYRCLGGNQYEIEVTFYRDCGGVAEPGNITINYKSANGNHNLNVTANKVAGSSNGLEITVPCATSASSCNGGSTTGIRKWIYRATVTLPSAQTDWVFSYSVCCRNCTITTISNPCASNSTLYVEAKLNNLTAPCNSSPTFSNIPIAFVCVGQNFNYNHGVIDPDGDSLAYSLIAPKTTATANVSFIAPLTATSPMATSTPFAINAGTGDINFTPSQIQIGVMAILVREFRGGQLIGSVIRDMQVYTQTCSNNLPTASGINGTTNYTINACPGQQVCFTVNSADLDASQNVTMTTNNGIPNASYTISGGSRPTLTFCWTPTNADINLLPKTFTVTVRDNACPSNGVQTYSFNIYVPSPYFAISGTNITCNGAATGTALASPVYSGVYTYAWSNGATTAAISGLTAGAYVVTATDAATGCTATQTITLTEPSGMTLTTTPTHPSCLGVSNGNINLGLVGGSGPYTYNWSNGSTNQNLSNVPAGTYTVTVTDANGCTKTASNTLNAVYSTSVTSSSTSAVSCFGGNNGVATATPSGGVTPYSYLWSNGANTATANNLPAGTYTVTATDANGCRATSTTTITQPTAALSTTSTKTDVNCFGQNTGSISVVASGGTSPYTYLWNNGSTTSTINNITAGSYSVTVTDANGCTSTRSVTITQPLAALNVTNNLINVNCFSQSTGAINPTVTGGTAPYTYLWNTGSTAANLNGLAAGTYTLTVTDSKGCTQTTTSTITQPAARVNATISSTNNVGCFGGNSGTINLNVTGGVTPYTYLWSTGANTQNLSGLSNGTYSVTVTDANGCTSAVNPIIITQPVAALSASTSKTNVSCFNGNTGNINLTPAGGTSPYTYLWSNGSTTQNINTLTAGIYSVTITDANNCQTTASVSITQPASAVSVSTTRTNVRCFGNNTGLTTAAGSGGTSPYTYSWSNGVNTATNNNLVAGTYTVTVTDANGCTTSTPVTITQPAAALAVSGTPTAVSCFNVPTGSIATSTTGGTSPYIYQWSNGGAGTSISNLSAGNYTVTVTDALGCTTIGNYTVTQPAAALSSSTSGNAVSCFGGSNGSANVNVNGGTIPYTYSWNTGSTNNSISGLSAGTYTVTATDANGCTVSNTQSISQPAAALSLSNSSTAVACFGNNSGSSVITPSGGTTPYTYIWSTGSTTQGISNLAAGSYTVTVTDANGCTSTSTSSISQPAAPLSLSATSNNIDCTGNSIGSVNVTPTGGTSPYTYQWSNGSNQQSIANLAANTYTATVTDANGCTAVISRTVTQPAGSLNVTNSVVNLLCFGDGNGSINVTANAGTPPYSYLWNTGSSNEDLSNLTAGSYTVTVTDNNGCSMTNSIFVTQPNAPLSATLANTAVDCFGNATGTTTLTVNGGTSSYNYAWSNGSTNQNLSSITSGTYTVTVTDANGCTTQTQTTVTEPAQALNITATTTDLNCHDVQDGALQTTVTGGTAGYTYSWSTGSNDPSISNLSTGSYSVTVTDANGCTASQNYNLNFAAPIFLSSATISAVACHGDSTGMIDLSHTGGTGPYLYKWSNNAATQDINFLTAGVYSVTITDANGCTTALTQVITQPAAPLSSNFTNNTVLCFGDATGVIDYTINGGTQGYSFLWSNGSTLEDLQQLTSGTYVVTVTDANGCILQDTIAITEPQAPLSSNFNIQQVACFGDNTGDIQTTINGGTNPYTYTWNNLVTTPNNGGLPAGTYSLLVVDDNGCILNDYITITEPAAPLSTSPTQVNIDCNGNGSGSADLNTAGGTAPYTYAWSNGSTQSTISGVTSGTYSYVVTDDQGCTYSDSIIITQPANALNVTPTLTQVLCFGDSTGAIDLGVLGGTPSYTYLWNDGNTNQNINNLAAGSYTVTVTDNYNCFSTQTFTIQEPTAPLSTTPTISQVNCHNGSDANIQLTTIGGTAPYTFNWNNGGNNSNIDSLAVGTYNVLITDAQGCTINGSYTITQPAAALSTTNSALQVMCFGDSTASIDLTVSGGTTPYTYSWSNGSNNEDLTNISAGSYTVLITDSNNCTYSETIVIAEPLAPLNATEQVNQVMCTGDSTGSVDLTINGGTAPYTYLWNTGGTAQDPISMPVGTYSVTVTDLNGCTANRTIVITEPDSALQAGASVGHISCYGRATGWIDVTAIGGTGAYTYLWNNGGTSEDPTQLLAGIYTVTVTDQNGCNANLTVLITQPAAFPAVSGTTTPVSCTGMQNGAIQSVVSGGTSPYTYQWSTGSTQPSISGLGAGIYTVTVTDAGGCSQQYSTQIIEPTNTLAVTATSSDANCITGQLGSISATPNGGTAPYSILWNTGATTNAISNQLPGSYTATVTDANGCVTTQSFSINDISNLALTTIGGTQICMGDMATLITDSVPNGTLQWYYNGVALQGATSNTFITPVAGIYTIMATTPCGTYTSNPIEITTRVLSNVSITNSVIICTGESTPLSAGGGIEYSWSPANGLSDSTISNPIASPTVTTEYMVTVKDQNGCTATASVTVSVICDTLDIPNGFSPNGDGTNDYFVIDGIGEYPGNILYIYNRWGNLVYKKKEYNNQWDGRSNVNGVMFGEELPNGTYYYILDLNVDEKPLNSYVVIRR